MSNTIPPAQAQTQEMTWPELPAGFVPEHFPPCAYRHHLDEEVITLNGIGMEAMPLYGPYFYKYGVVRAVQLAAPRLNKLDALELPKETVLHYLAEDETELGLSQSSTILHNNTRMIMTEHVTELGDNKGAPRTLAIPSAQYKREYHRQNRRTREMLKPETAMRDVETIVMVNYALLNHLYRYPTNYFRAYYKWWNIQTALWKKAGQIGKAYPTRHQFLQCRLPTLLPTLSLLRRGEGEMTRSLLGQFTQPESLMILEIWKWLGEHREASALSFAAPEDLAKMNLIFIEQDRWLVLNLGLLDQWRKHAKGEVTRPSHVGVLEPQMVQKRFLRLLMSLMEVRTVTDGENALTAPTPTSTAIVPAQADVKTVATEVPASPMSIVKSEPVRLDVPNEDGGTSKIKLTANLNLDRLPEALVEETPENIALIDEAISRDLEALDFLMARYEERMSEGVEDAPVDASSNEVTAMIKYEPENRSLSESIMARVHQQADAGLITGAEYRRLSALSTAYQRIPNPFGEGTLADMLVIPKEDLVLPTVPQIPDSAAVPDKSMLKSSIMDFDRQYLEKVYRKDLVRMVMAVQHGGYAVTGMALDEYQDALNHYEKFSVKFTPVEGKESTVYFKLPKIKPDGSYTDNGSRYRSRKQRIDKPIRKVSPSRVSLTSYYNKISINRSDKQVHNYANWLTNRVAAVAVDDNDQRITNGMLANVADTTIMTPRIYSVLASRFRSFQINFDKVHYELFFDYHSRKAEYGIERVEEAEKTGMLVIGRTEDNLLVIDQTNLIYKVKGSEIIDEGSPIESLLQISQAHTPAEMAEIRIFGKQIPVGMFLAYELGLTELFKLMGVTPRKVPTGTRAYMADDEQALRFSDETWIFPQDRTARTLVLSGLVQFEKSTRNYPAHLFDRKDIYLNVLEQSRVGARYLREMDQLTDMFVDPITEDILKDMGEPTDFIGLVLRACQLLETDWSPAETDMAFMRIKGYERFAGAVYAELVKAIRTQRSRGSAANAKIDLHPDAVWIGIQLDPVKKAVEESNPVHCLRESEEVTFSGVGGRSARSMVARTRVFHPNDMGVISESTKDSADVAIATFTPADPTLVDVRGMTRRFDPAVDGSSSILSSPALLSPGADRDD